jgi:hypothetical protein
MGACSRLQPKSGYSIALSGRTLSSSALSGFWHVGLRLAVLPTLGIIVQCVCRKRVPKPGYYQAAGAMWPPRKKLGTEPVRWRWSIFLRPESAFCNWDCWHGVSELSSTVANWPTGCDAPQHRAGAPMEVTAFRYHGGQMENTRLRNDTYDTPDCLLGAVHTLTQLGTICNPSTVHMASRCDSGSPGRVGHAFSSDAVAIDSPWPSGTKRPFGRSHRECLPSILPVAPSIAAKTAPHFTLHPPHGCPST